MTISLLLLIGIMVAVGAGDDWNRGQNRIRNSDFEGDEVGQPPKEWTLKKGG